MKKQLAYNRQERQRKRVMMDSVGKGIEKKNKEKGEGGMERKRNLNLIAKLKSSCSEY